MMNNMKIGVYTYNDDSFNFNFRTDLRVSEKLKFVNTVVSLLVDESHYNSVIRDLVFDFYVVDMMTDIDVAELKESSMFLNDAEDFLLSTNIIEIVRANASPLLFDELNDAIDKSISYLTGIHHSPVADSIASLLSTIEKKINEVDLDGMIGMVEKLAGITGELTPESIIDAYMTSDAHMKNVAEIDEAKKKRAEFAKDMDKAIKIVNEK